MSDGVTEALRRIVAEAARAEEYARAAHQSLTEVLEIYTAYVPPKPVVHEVWRGAWPANVYPSATEWQLIQRALDSGAVVLCDVGLSVVALKIARLETLTWTPGQPKPVNMAGRLTSAGALLPLCPAYGATPDKALWSCAIWGVEELGA